MKLHREYNYFPFFLALRLCRPKRATWKYFVANTSESEQDTDSDSEPEDAQAIVNKYGHTEREQLYNLNLHDLYSEDFE